MVITGPVRRGPVVSKRWFKRRFQLRTTRSGMHTTELRAKIRAVPTGGLFFRLLTR